jgi:hypothetical protein
VIEISRINKIELVRMTGWLVPSHLMHSTQCDSHESIARTFSQLKEGDTFKPIGSGKTFTKWAGLLVAPDMEAREWIRSNVAIDFFNDYVVMILHASPERFSISTAKKDTMNAQKWT